MSVVEEIHKATARIAQGVKARVSRIQGELAQIEAKKAAIEAELRAACSMEGRLFNFQPQVNGDFQCPVCWIEHEKRSVLSPNEGGDDPRGFLALSRPRLRHELPARERTALMNVPATSANADGFEANRRNPQKSQRRSPSRR